MNYWLWIIPTNAEPKLWDFCRQASVAAMQQEFGVDRKAKSARELAAQITVGDKVVAYLNRNLIGGVGTVTKPFFDDPTGYQSKSGHGWGQRVGVKWHVPGNPIDVRSFPNVKALPILNPLKLSVQTIHQISQDDFEQIDKVVLGNRSDLPEPPPIPLSSNDWKTALSRSFSAQNLVFTPWQLATFYTALQTKGFVILSGISGTGKTKLAQHFAEMLPQPIRHAEIQEEGTINLTIQPDHLKNSRFIIPQRAILLFDPPPPNVSQEVRVTLSGQTQDCRLSHYSYGRADYLLLYLRGLAAKWLTQNFEVGDKLVLKPEVDENQKLVGLQAMTEIEFSEQAKQTEPTQPVGAPRNWLFVPVRPDWRDSKSLLGYFNPLTGTYEWTSFLRFLLRAAQSYRDEDGLAWLVILDEMNLAHVEYYFADLLSVLESGRDGEGWTREPLRLLYPDEAEGDLPPRELRLPPNLYIVGTVNVDETTHAFSPKVLDRAFTLELTEADFSTYLTLPLEENAELGDMERRALLRGFTFDSKFTRCGYVDKQHIAEHLSNHPQVRTRLQTLNDLLRRYDLHFGYRVFDEILWFLEAAESNELFADLGGDQAAFDAAVLMKVLPKFHGSRGKLEAPLRAVLAWCVDPDAPAQDAIADALRQIEAGDDVAEVLSQITFRYPVTAERARRMLRSLYTDGFAAFG